MKNKKERMWNVEPFGAHLPWAALVQNVDAHAPRTAVDIRVLWNDSDRWKQSIRFLFVFVYESKM